MLGLAAVVLGAAAGAPPAANETHCGADFCTWWHGSGELNAATPVGDENVRQSRRYLVLVGAAGAGQFAHSFAYEAIPRNGNGAILRPTDPPHSGTFNGSAGNAGGDGITVEHGLVSMAWSQFEHAVDVDVKILPRDGTALGPASAVVVRPLSLGLRARASPDGGVLIRVPKPSEASHGLQFSVEFASDLHTYRSDGNGYVESGGSVVGLEPSNALLIFASPFLPAEALPPPTAARKVMRPGPIREGDWGAAPVLHFPAGVYWLEPKGQSRILLDPATQWVHLDGGAFVKGAVEFTTQSPQFAATGHGVLSGEQYVYQANPEAGWSSVKSDQDSLRMWRHNRVAAGQSLLLRGPTCAAPPFNSMDLFGFGSGSVHISDYKQVGAWWFQTDGPEMGTWELSKRAPDPWANPWANGMHSPGSVVQDVFYHVNDDGLKLYSSNVTVRNATIWKCHNDPILQMGWAVRAISNVKIAGLRVIHTRYNTLPSDVVPQAIIGVSNGGGVAQPNATLSAEISDVVCEGLCPALMHITPLQSYQLTLRDIHFPDGLLSGPIGLGRSQVKPAAEGVEVKMRLEIADWTVGEETVTMENFQSDRLGQFDISSQYWGQWHISSSGDSVDRGLAPAAGDDLAIVTDRVVRSMLPSDAHAAQASAAQLGRQLLPNGSWPDIDYHEFRRADWPMTSHLSRVSSMAGAWRADNTSAAAPALLANATSALECWLLHDWKNPNWYDNEIGVPRQMGEIALLLSPPGGSALSATDGAKMSEIMARADWLGHGTYSHPQWTGANLLDMLRIQIHRGLFLHNKTLVEQGFARSFADVVPHSQSGESIMVDHSFHQHGPQLLAGAYGAVFTSDILGLSDISADTEFAMPAAAIKVFEGLVLDGQARMSRGGSWDWQVHGRGVSEGVMELGFSTSEMRRFGTALSPSRGAEWAAFAHRIDTDDSSTAAALVGTSSYYDSDYIAHNRPGFMFSVHSFSKRTIPAACVNEQGKLDRHLSDGATALYKTGHEYDDIFPVWNWTHPPGTTVATAAEPPSCGNARHSTEATFVGSCTDGARGVAVQHLQGGSRTESLTAAANCTGGLAAGDICCAKQCGECSGKGCSSRPGGAKDCCSSGIHRHCSSTVGPPCRMGPSPAPAPSRYSADATANKTWLLFEDAIVASGEAEIPREGGLVTGVEQSRLQGPVLVGQSGSTEAPGTWGPMPAGSARTVNLSKAGAWVLHNGVGYLMPPTPGATLHVSNNNKSGSWSLIGVGSDQPVTMAVFDMFIAHEKQYQYLVVPNATVAEMPSALTSTGGYTLAGGGSSGFTAASNSAGDVLLAAVWSHKGAAVDTGCWSVEASRACVFALHKWQNGTISASASVPGADGNLTLTIMDSACEGAAAPTWTGATGDGCSKTNGGSLTLEFALPSGDYTGSSVDVVCAPTPAQVAPPQSASASSVGFSDRALLIDGRPRFLTSGGFHYPRASPGSWRAIMRAMKANGLNTITTYAFWELHERRRGVYDWGQLRPEANVTAWLALAQEEGLFVHMRIGPYINANWQAGGFPAWLRGVPGIEYRTDNAPFKREMGRWFRDFVEHIRPFLRPVRGGPVISVQVENEYTYSTAADNRYIDWAAAMCHNATRGAVPCTMCNNTGSPTLPDYPNTVFTCNADCNAALHVNARETWIDGHVRAYPNQPSLYSEIEVSDPGWSSIPSPGDFQATSLAYEATRFVADGGSGTNYWMWFGGTNFGSGGSNDPTTFMWGAPLGSFGQPNQPVFDHIGRMHKMFVAHEATLLSQPVPPRRWIGSAEAYSRSYKSADGNLTFWVNFGGAAVVGQPGLVLPSGGVVVTDGDKVIFNTSDTQTVGAAQPTATATASGSLRSWQFWEEPLPGRPEWTGPPSTVASEYPLNDFQLGSNGLTTGLTDYIKYTSNFSAEPHGRGSHGDSELDALVCSLTLLLSDATTAYVWLDGTFLQVAGVLDNSQHNGDWKTFVVQLPGNFSAGSTHRLDLMTMNLGFNDDWAIGTVYPHMGENSRKGVLAHVSVYCAAPGHGDATAGKVEGPPTAGQALTSQACGKLTVQPITENQAWLLPTPVGVAGLVHFQGKSTGLCLAVSTSDPGMPALEIAKCSATAQTQQWAYNKTTHLLVSGVQTCDGGPECALSELGSGAYKAGDPIVLYGKNSGEFGTNQLVTVEASPTGVGSQLKIAVAQLCVTAGGSKHPLPPPPPPPGRPIRGWLQLNGTVGEFHRLFTPSVAASWSGWSAVASATDIASRPTVWLRATFSTPPATGVPLALRMGNATAGATKGKSYVNGKDIGQFWSRSLDATRQPSGPQLYLIPEDFLRKEGNELVLFEEVGVVGGLGAIEVVRAAQAWG